VKNSIIAYLSTFSEYGGIIPDEDAKTVNDVVTLLDSQLFNIQLNRIPTTVARVDIEQGDSCVELMVRSAINNSTVAANMLERPRAVGAYYLSDPSIRSVTNALPNHLLNSVNAVIITCATQEYAHICELSQSNSRTSYVIGKNKIQQDTYDDEETREGAELLKKDIEAGIGSNDSGTLAAIKEHPQFSELHPETGNKAAIVLPKFIINDDIIKEHRCRESSSNTHSVKFNIQFVPRDRINEYLQNYHNEDTKKKNSVKAANLLIAEIVNFLTTFKPLIDTDGRWFSIPKFIIDMHEKIAHLGATREITIRDVIKFVDGVIPECYQESDETETPHAVTMTFLSASETNIKILRDCIFQETGTTVNSNQLEILSRGLAQTAYRIVRKRFYGLPKFESIARASTTLKYEESVSYCQVVDVIERNNARLAVCREVSLNPDNDSIVFIVATAENNRRIYDSLDKDAILIKPQKDWSFGIVENENIIKKCGVLKWSEVISDASPQSENIRSVVAGYTQTESMTRLNTSVSKDDNDSDLVGTLMGSYLKYVIGPESRDDRSYSVCRNLCVADKFDNYFTYSQTRINGLPKSWGHKSYGTMWAHDSIRGLLYNDPCVNIVSLTAQQLGTVTVRRVTEKVAEDAKRSAATAFNRGVLRLIATGKEFKFALNASSAEMVVRKDEIIFGGRKIKSALVAPVPSAEEAARLFSSRACSTMHSLNEALTETIVRLSSLCSADEHIKTAAINSLEKDPILISFLLQILQQLKSVNLNTGKNARRILFDHRYSNTFSSDDDHQQILEMNIRIERYQTTFFGSNVTYNVAADLGKQVKSIMFYPDSDVEELFDFDNLVSNVVGRSLLPELTVGSQMSDNNLINYGLRVSQLDANKWVVDELTIGDVSVVVTAVSSLDKRNIKTTRYFINEQQIKTAELIRVVKMATCFQDTNSYNEAVAQISEVSLAARDLLQNGFKVDVETPQSRAVSHTRSTGKHLSIMLEFERVKNKWSLIIRDKDGNIKKNLHIPGGVSRFVAVSSSRTRRKTIDVETFSNLIGDIPDLEFIDIKRIHENGFTRYNQVIARSRKFLEDVIRTVNATYGVYKIGSRQHTGYCVKGMSGKSYVVACQDIAKDKPFEHDHGTEKFGAIYSVETGEYVCVVDRSSEQSGYDVIANRLLAMANDVALVDQIHTLGKFVN
jgi:hypothetical protein